jgi:hypothetical protein
VQKSNGRCWSVDSRSACCRVPNTHRLERHHQGVRAVIMRSLCGRIPALPRDVPYNTGKRQFDAARTGRFATAFGLLLPAAFTGLEDMPADCRSMRLGERGHKSQKLPTIGGNCVWWWRNSNAAAGDRARVETEN